MYRGIRKALSIAGFLTGIWVFIHFLLPLCFPFLLGGALALAAEPMVAFLSRRAHLRRGTASALGVSAAFAFLMLVLLLLCALLIRELGMLMSVLPDLEAAASGGISALSGWALSIAARLPGGLREYLSQGITDFFSEGSQLLSQGFRFLVSLTGGVLRQVPDSALIFGTAVISSYMISGKLPRIISWLKDTISQPRIEKLKAGFRRVRDALFGWLKAQFKLMGITWLILTMGFVLLRIPYAPLWAAAVSLVDAFPVLGVGTVLLPWALICLIQGSTPRAIGLLGIYVVISLGRSALEPKIVGNQLGLDPLATLAAVYAGYTLWGLGGMIFAPVLAVAAIQLLRDPEL